MRRRMLLSSIIFSLSLFTSSNLLASDNAINISKQETLKTLLVKLSGKNVTLKLESGQELTGQLNSVGQHLVELNTLQGREFFNAIIMLDGIDGVIIRNR